MPTNNFLEFCPTDSGTNLPTQGAYLADADRVSGNKPGVASSKLNNKALRQANYVTSQLAQMVGDKTATDMLDDATPARLLSQFKAVLLPVAPITTIRTSGSGNHNLTYVFYIASGNATSGATYTNNTVTFTVRDTVAAGVVVMMTGNGAPLASGTLTKSGGAGDSTLTFYAFRAPLFMQVRMAGGGGGAGGANNANNASGGGGGAAGYCEKLYSPPSGTYAYVVGANGTGGSAGGSDGTDGTASTFGGLTAFGGGHGAGSPGGGPGGPGNGGGATGGDLNVGGGYGGIGAGSSAADGSGGNGGASYFGGGGNGGQNGPVSNSDAIAYGAGGGGGGARGAGQSGGLGAGGVIIVTESFQ